MLSFRSLALFFATLSGISASPDAWSRLWNPCPAACGSDSLPRDWAVYHGIDRLSACNQTTRLEFSLYSDNPSHSAIRACTSSPEIQSLKDSQVDVSEDFAEEDVSLQLGWWDIATSSPPAIVKPVVEDVRRNLLDSANDKPSTFFSYSGNVLVGLYAGKGILHSDAATSTVQMFMDYIESQNSIGRVALQYCGVNSNKGLGIVVDTGGNLSAVQKIMRGWKEAKCQTGFDGNKNLIGSKLHIERHSSPTSGPSKRHLAHSHSHSHHRRSHWHQQRATCQTIQVASGDSCASLANSCGITPADFTKYNPDGSLCSSLQPGQHVCCSAGQMPDFSPKPDPDGMCASIVVQPGDSCSEIASSNSINQKDLENFNKNTWGWMGCESLQAQQRICLSKGDPPMPAAINNAVCGPQVPGTEKPTNGTKLADLNPCPLKTCCNIWGQCGITDDFCTITESPTGAPGTAKKGTDGCISHCGTDIVNNDTGPDEFIAIGYFEAWNLDRGCLNMDVTTFDSAAYTHIHFAFAEITDDYDVDISKVEAQFKKLKGMSSVNRILSFGGWSFSTEADSAPIFRQGVTDANRELFATNVARFIVDNDLEGIDFDWEYPGAPDIPGIPPGDSGDGERYLQFLKAVRQKLPEDKSLAIAAPASFWYLKGFPIAEISDVVDYIVFMSYDLHGQWDFGNQYAIQGCPTGDCLRSHVNLTETNTALSMITKAGVPSSKIIVGLSSYGRSFKMTQAGCTGPMCKYVGPDSAATPGNCTDTPGYIADAEINRILNNDSSAKKTYDKSSDSNILVYDTLQWVAFMDGDTKRSRTDYYQGLNMGGTTDWAVDLQSFADSPSNQLTNQTTVAIDQSIWTEEKPEVQCPAPCVLVLPDYPLSSTSVISRPPYTTTLDVAWPTKTTTTNPNGDVVTTSTVTRILQETTIVAPPVTVSSLPMANINITIPLDNYDNISFQPKPRFPPQIVTITNDPNPLKETGVTHPPVTRSVTLPPWPQDTVMYIPSRDYGEDEDNNNNNDDDNDSGDDSGDDDDDDGDDNNNNNDNSDNDHDLDLPDIPSLSFSKGPGKPKCKNNCPSPCSDSFCSCIFCPSSNSGDGGFSDPNDPAPPARPPNNPLNPRNERNPSSCSEPSSTTNYWVSCETGESQPTSTSCRTTSSMVVVGCDVTATTTTTGVEVCNSVDPNEDQGENGTRMPISTTRPPKVSATTTSPSKTTAKTTTTSAIQTFTPTSLPPSKKDPQFVIYAFELRDGGESSWSWVGMVLPARDYDDDDVCGGDYRVLMSHDFTKSDAYPDYLGSFSADGQTGCEYRSNGSDPGDVYCDGVKLPCLGFDSLHSLSHPSSECVGNNGQEASYWMQGWCPMEK